MVKSRLAVILAERGMKQKFLADKTGISTSTMSAIVNGQMPQLDNALRIAKVLGVTVEEIWSLDIEQIIPEKRRPKEGVSHSTLKEDI